MSKNAMTLKALNNKTMTQEDTVTKSKKTAKTAKSTKADKKTPAPKTKKPTKKELAALAAEQAAREQKAQDMLKATIASFPKTFKLPDWEGMACSIDPKNSQIDPETGEEKLAIRIPSGETVAVWSPKTLAALVKAKAPRAAKEPKAKGERKPKGTGQRKTESNIPLMARLLTEGKDADEILAVFTARYTEEGVAHKTPLWIAQRVAIYAKIAMQTLLSVDSHPVGDSLQKLTRKTDRKVEKKPTKTAKPDKKAKAETPAAPVEEQKSKKQLKLEAKAAAEAEKHAKSHSKAIKNAMKPSKDAPAPNPEF